MIYIWIVLGIVALIGGLFIFGLFNAIRASIARDQQLDEMIEPAILAIEKDPASAKDVILQFAKLPATRNHLFSKLKELGKTEAFPDIYRSIEKIAESDMVKWLMHPNELKEAPTDIELIRDVAVNQDDKKGKMFLFKFRIDAPHWASDNGWMAGIAGPYWDGEELPDTARDTFSEFKQFDTMTAEEHINHIRQALDKRGLIVRC